ncbi:MAG: DUF1326 domain-containing protein [Candidatus Kuenenia sp.]|nr:DUF1326 domain-containing protein [Candidatus Kuenenia hertensis]
MRTKFNISIMVMALCCISFLYTSNVIAGGKYSAEGVFVEGCNCDVPCPCELISFEMGCETIAAISLSMGEFEGENLSGAKIAYATEPGKWVRIYVDAKDEKQKQAATRFAESVFASFGKVEKTDSAKINFSGSDGKYNVTVNDGKIASLSTEPILGGDNKTPVIHMNTKSKLSPVFMQGRVVSGNYSDGDRNFEFKGTNAYFNTNIKCEKCEK